MQNKKGLKKVQKLFQKKNLKNLSIFVVVILLIISVILILFVNYYKSPEKQIGLSGEIEEFVISEDGLNAYIRIAGGSDEQEVEKIKFILKDSEGNEYVYETFEGVGVFSVPYKDSFFYWLGIKPKYEGSYDYQISLDKFGLGSFENIENVTIVFGYSIGGVDDVDVDVETPVLDTAKPTTTYSGGGGGTYVPPVTPISCTLKTCVDYSGQCGASLDNGCSGTIDCSTNCAIEEYCYIGEGINEVCIDNSINCTDSDEIDFNNKGNVTIFNPENIFIEDICVVDNSTDYYCYYNGTDFEVRNQTFECGFRCLGPECESNENCVDSNILGIDTCVNPIDDGIDSTWDFRQEFTSTCDVGSTNACILGDETIVSDCDLTKGCVGAVCDDSNPCDDTICGGDGCIGNDWYDYTDVSNNCLEDCSCESNSCGSPTIIIDDVRCVPPTQGLVSWWKFDGDMLDSELAGNDGTCDDISGYCPTLTTDRNDEASKAYDFTNDLINFGSDTSIDNIFNGGGTVSAWIYLDSYGVDNMVYVINKYSGADGDWIFWIRNDVLGSNALHFSRDFDGTNGYWIADSVLSIGQWTHVAITYNDLSDTNNPIIYINGQPTSIDVSSRGDVPAGPSGTAGNDEAISLFVGGRATDSLRDFDGSIDDIMIYNEILDSTEVLDLYNSQKPVAVVYECNDGIDNDLDGAIDYPADFSCDSSTDNDETNPLAECQDGEDNDGDTFTDFPADLDCDSSQDNSELGCVPDTCISLGYECGDWDDGCGGMTGSCGDCDLLYPGEERTCQFGTCVAPAGDCTTTANPSTLMSVVSSASSGAVICLDGGDYGSKIFTSAYAKPDWITIRGMDRDNVKFDSIYFDPSGGTNIYNIKIDNITLEAPDSAQHYGIRIGDGINIAANVQILNSKIYGLGYSAYQVDCVDYAPLTSMVYLHKSKDILIQGNDIYNTGGDAYGVQIDSDVGEIIIKNNNITNVTSSGVLVGGGNAGVYHTLIEGNYLMQSPYGMSVYTFECKGDDAHAGGSGIAIRTHNIDVKDNIFAGYWGTRPIRTYQSQTGNSGYSNILIESNLVRINPTLMTINHGNIWSEFHDAGDNFIIRNNTFEGYVQIFLADYADGSELTLENNIVQDQLDITDVYVAYNPNPYLVLQSAAPLWDNINEFENVYSDLTTYTKSIQMTFANSIEYNNPMSLLDGDYFPLSLDKICDGTWNGAQDIAFAGALRCPGEIPSLNLWVRIVNWFKGLF